MSNLFTPGSFNVVKPHMARDQRGDSGPPPPSTKPKIPTAQPIKGKSPRKKAAHVSRNDNKSGSNSSMSGGGASSKENPVDNLHVNVSPDHAPILQSNQYGDLSAPSPIMHGDPMIHSYDPAMAFTPQTVAYGFPADAYSFPSHMDASTMPYGAMGMSPMMPGFGGPSPGAVSMPPVTHSSSLPDIHTEKQREVEELERLERERIKRQERDVEDIKSMVAHIKTETTKVPFDPALHISLKDMQEKIRALEREKDSTFEAFKSKSVATTEAMVKDHIQKQTAAHEKEVELEEAVETLKEAVAQLDKECHRLESEAEQATTERGQTAKQLEVVSGEKKTLEEQLIDAENRYASIESENEVLSTNLKKCNDDLTHARQEAVVSVFKLKKAMESHKLQSDQIDRLKKNNEALKKEVSDSKKSYDEIVKWAKTTEEAHRKHDEEVHRTMNNQHEKFNVEYEFLGKQNKVLKEEVRSLNHELKDAKALLEHGIEQMKDLHRDQQGSKASEKKLKKKVEELQQIVDEHEHATEDLVRKFNMQKERDVGALNYSHDREVSKLSKIIVTKEGIERDLNSKLDFVRKKVKDMEADIKNRDRRIILLEEQVLFETKMREINMQKRTEKEQGGLEAIVQLLRINESNSHALSTLNDTNTKNLEVVRGDIETLLKKIAPATAEALALRDLDKSKKKKQAKEAKKVAKAKAAVKMVGMLGAIRESNEGLADLAADLKIEEKKEEKVEEKKEEKVEEKKEEKKEEKEEKEEVSAKATPAPTEEANVKTEDEVKPEEKPVENSPPKPTPKLPPRPKPVAKPATTPLNWGKASGTRPGAKPRSLSPPKRPSANLKK